MRKELPSSPVGKRATLNDKSSVVFVRPSDTLLVDPSLSLSPKLAMIRFRGDDNVQI